MKKELEFEIVYIVNGEKKIERIKAERWSRAKQICESKGEFVSCEYQETTNDLLYPIR
jgi:hypothetical protein